MPLSEIDIDYIRKLKRVYDGLDVKDMPWEKFRDEMMNMRDPDKIEKDLADITARKARERVSRERILRALEN